MVCLPLLITTCPLKKKKRKKPVLFALVMESSAKASKSAAVTLIHSSWHAETSEIECGRQKVKRLPVSITERPTGHYQYWYSRTWMKWNWKLHHRLQVKIKLDKQVETAKKIWGRVHWSEGSMDTWEYEGSEQAVPAKSFNTVYCSHRRTLFAASPD